MYKEQLRDYKFYLSFENAYCNEYITEKFFLALKTEQVIPVALGGFTREDYAKFAPPKSYLHIDDFETPGDLAKTLEYLASNETAYKEYFWWTNHYKVSSLIEGYESAQCQLCDVLNRVKRNKLKLPPVNLTDYWNSETKCRNTKVH